MANRGPAAAPRVPTYPSVMDRGGDAGGAWFNNAGAGYYDVGGNQASFGGGRVQPQAIGKFEGETQLENCRLLYYLSDFKL